MNTCVKKTIKENKVKKIIFYDEDSNLSTNEFHIMKNVSCTPEDTVY